MPNYIIRKLVRGKPLVRGGALPPSISSQYQYIERFILSLQRLSAYNFVDRSDNELDNFDAAIARMSEEISSLVNYLTEVGRENPSLAGVANELKMRLQASATELANHLERYDEYLAEIEG
jgi:chromosome segregation ATPase